MERCNRCQRYHSLRFPCGIPARAGRAGNPTLSRWGIKGKPPVSKLSTSMLENLLKQAKEHYKKVFELLKIFPKEMTEMDEARDLLDREGKLASLIKQLEGQIAVRKGFK